MLLPAFDTHAYVKTLKSVGFTEQQAEVQAELNSKILSELVTEKLATKDDIGELRLSIMELRNSAKSYGIGIGILGIFITIINFIHVFIPTFHV
jgi:hypothetical protein